MTKIINTNTRDNVFTNPVEDMPLISVMESLLRDRKSSKEVVEMPPRGSPVLACMSGGLDSTAIIAILLEEFGYNVYPFFINRGQSNIANEVKSRDFYDNFFKEHYPDTYHGVKELDITIPVKGYKDMLRNTKHLKDNPALRKRNTYPARNPVMFLAGMEYGYSLQSTGVFPKSLFIAEQADDFSVHGSLTLMRIMNVLFCYLLDDWDWQFISLPIEKELGNYYGKDVLVKYCSEHNIPLEHTVSCTTKEELQCGVCAMACWDRRMAFKKAGVEDKTQYQYPMPIDKDHCKKDE